LRKELNIFWSRGFLGGLFVLLVNDHILKSIFDNWLTGKLSDLAGLFIFPIFFSALIPKYRKHIYWITALGFIWWKSPLSNSFLELWNKLPLLDVSRVMDWTDLVALIVLPFSYMYFENYNFKKFRLSPVPLIVVSSFAFIATSRAHYIPMYYQYNLPYSKEELIRRLNAIAKEDEQLPISTHIENSNYIQNQYGDSMRFYVSKYTDYRDTFYNKEGSVDTVMLRKIPVKDTAYISGDLLYYEMNVRKYFQKESSDYCNSVIAKLMITGDGSRSTIKLLGFDTYNCEGIFDDKRQTDEILKMQKVIEKKLKKK
jgi:hypothetical protein